MNPSLRRSVLTLLALSAVIFFASPRAEAQGVSLSVNLGSVLDGVNIDTAALAGSIPNAAAGIISSVENGDTAQRIAAFNAYQARRSARLRRAREIRRVRAFPTRNFNPGYYVPYQPDYLQRSSGFVIGPRF